MKKYTSFIFKFIFSVLVFSLLFSGLRAQNLADSVFKSYSDLQIGIDAGGTSGSFAPALTNAVPYHNFATGISASLSTSFLLDYFARQTGHRFKIGDIFSGMLQTGYHYESQSDVHSSWWTAYRFQIGLALNYAVNRKQDLGINFILLDFSHNQLYQNNSGSGIDLNYRFNRVGIDAGAEATRVRFTGWSQIASAPNTVPHLYLLKGTYLLNRHHKAGIQAEWFSNSQFQGMDPATGLTARSIFLTRVFYGMYF